MAFVNLSLLAGALLIAVPIVLHLTMRQQPKQYVFPAIRFLKQRRESNKRKLQLRHWVLLFLRCGAIAAAALMLARPSTSSTSFGNWVLVGIAAAIALLATALTFGAMFYRRGRALIMTLAIIAIISSAGTLAILVPIMAKQPAGLIGDQEAPVAAAIVIDSAPRMAYRHGNQTRLEAAKELAQWITQQLPEGSDVAVLDTRPGPAVFSVDLSAATKAIDRMEPAGAAGPIVRTVEEAIRLVTSNEKRRKEIYILTDMTSGAWEATSRSLATDLESASNIFVSVVDVGIKDPTNFSVRNIELSSELLARGGEVTVRVEVAHAGNGGKRTVDMLLEDPDPTRPVLQDGKLMLPNVRVRGQQECEFRGNGSQQLEFRLRGLEQGVQHGSVRIVGEDGLAFDDVRHFTLEVKQAWPLLVVAPDGVLTKFFVESVSPFEWKQQGRALFDCQVIAQSALANTSLADFAAIALIDPGPLTPGEWQQLDRYVQSGGGLVIFLGSHAHPVTSFNEPIAQSLIGGKLAREWRTTADDLFLSPERFEHPTVSVFRNQIVPWSQLPVYRHWVLEPLAEDSHVIIPFSNNRPALIERSVGKGRVVVMTTPVSEPVEPVGRTAWNELFTAEDAWPPVILMDQIARFIVSSGDAKLNYLTGEPAVLNNNPDRDPERYQLFSPTAETQDVVARDQRLSVRFTDDAGTYRLKGFRGSTVLRGFSVNVPPAACDLARTTPEGLDNILGAKRYQFATSREEINRGIGEARMGREFYSYLVLGLVVMLGLEQLLANRFYRRDVAATERPSTIAARVASGA